MAFTVSVGDNNVVAIIDEKIDNKAKCCSSQTSLAMSCFQGDENWDITILMMVNKKSDIAKTSISKFRQQL